MSAGAAKRTTCHSGKFHGITARTGPSGWYRTRLRPADDSITSSASSDSACSANQRIALAHFDASPFAEANVLPISVVSTRAMSGISPSSSSAAVTSSRARSANVVRRNVSNVAAARASRASTSSAVWSSNVCSTSPVAGFVVAKAMRRFLPARLLPARP